MRRLLLSAGLLAAMGLMLASPTTPAQTDVTFS